MQSKFALFFFILVGLSINSCHTKKTLAKTGFQNEFFGIEGLDCTQTLSPKAIDSKVGTLDCGNISFTYDYGKYSNPGPLTPEEEFTRTFDTYYHIKFFEYRMIDPKVYKLFFDSVQVVEVRSKSASDKGFFECKPCNAIAEITFMGDTYLYPLTVGENQINRDGYTCSFEEKDDMTHKYFQEDNANPGLYITPKNNRFKNKNTLSLKVSETTLPNNEITQILKKVYLKNNQN